MGRVVCSEQCAELVNEIAGSVWRNPTVLLSLACLKTHDHYSDMHSVVVAALMAALAKQRHLGEAQTRMAAQAGLLHDMGKAVMPPHILNKPGKLTDEEFAIIRTHPQYGHALLQADESVHDAVLDVWLHHHEKMDGSGYPDKLSGGQISLFARMGTVCDVETRSPRTGRTGKAGIQPSRLSGWSAGPKGTSIR